MSFLLSIYLTLDLFLKLAKLNLRFANNKNSSR